MKYVVRFALFWYDFIVGDCWQLAAGVLVALVLAWLLAGSSSGLSELLGPALALIVMLLLGGSLWLEMKGEA